MNQNEIRRCIEQVRGDYGAFINDEELGLLCRWANNDYAAVDALRNIVIRAEAAQNSSVSTNEIKTFIVYVIEEWRVAEQINEATEKIVKGRRVIAQLLPKSRRRFAQRITKNQISAEKFAETQNRLAQIEREQTEAQRAGPVSLRSNRDGSRARTEFMRGLSKLVRELTGGFWLDDAVAAIASVVFKREIHADHIRSASRETTRAGRKAKGQGPSPR